MNETNPRKTEDYIFRLEKKDTHLGVIVVLITAHFGQFFLGTLGPPSHALVSEGIFVLAALLRDRFVRNVRLLAHRRHGRREYAHL